MSNSISFAEVLVSQTFKKNGNEIRQIFSYNKRDKNKKYILDHRYLMYDKFEKKIRELSIQLEGSINFKKRIDDPDNGTIVLIYELVDENSDILESLVNNYNFKIVDYIPPNPGCAYCIFRQEKEGENFFYCSKKEKTMTDYLKNCKYFKQQRLYKS